MNKEDVAYLSIVRWPGGYTRQQMVEALVDAAGMDPFVADQRVAKGVPAVVHRLDAALAPDVLKHLHKRNVAALAPARSQMESIAPALKAKRLVEAIGSPEPMYMCEMWRDEGRGLLPRELFLIVRARLRRIERGRPEAEVDYNYNYATGYAVPEVHIIRKDKSSLSEVMDLYLRDGSRIRISGDKFNFDVLGDERGLSDNENADKLALKLAEQSPKVLVDTKFAEFICPPDFVLRWRTSTGGKEVRDDHPAFEFYSVWACLVYRRLAARER